MDITKLLVKSMLQNASSYAWTIHGLGKIQLPVSKDIAIHVWNLASKASGVSSIHDHPWGFTSTVIAGQITNVRYEETSRVNSDGLWTYHTLNLDTATVVDQPSPTFLRKSLRIALTTVVENVNPGESYWMKSQEIHDTVAVPGTVTLISRNRANDNRLCRAFWRSTETFGSANPRQATVDEVNSFVSLALPLFGV